MKIWIILQLVIDIILFIIVIGYFTRSAKKEAQRKKRSNKLPLNELAQIKDSIKKLLTESEDVSFVLTERISQGRQLITAIDEKWKEFDSEPERKSKTSALHGSENRYNTVANLVREGLTTGEISKRTDIPEGEVELIVNLKAH